MAELRTPPNTLLRIEEVWVFVSVDQFGNEGVCGAHLPGLGFTALIAADEGRLASLMPVARDIATQSRMTIRLMKLSTRTEVLVINP